MRPKSCWVSLGFYPNYELPGYIDEYRTDGQMEVSVRDKTECLVRCKKRRSKLSNYPSIFSKIDQAAYPFNLLLQ